MNINNVWNDAKIMGTNKTIRSQMVWLLQKWMRNDANTYIRFWFEQHLNIATSKNLISNFSSNQQNSESSNHIRLPNAMSSSAWQRIANTLYVNGIVCVSTEVRTSDEQIHSN